ncbi:MCE family protein [Nocardia cyriacigeorgica]|uniref:MCE family protein n=1 Tax=Nocardia cyriacigeorgica TaxID=135487 RepID=A0A5R8PB62_9NOCA|nr:MlaD family protein [Nocardia cyriacigeorgica]TLG05294.1 MCE family protein [Nocardia cyriacigeorgica]
MPTLTWFRQDLLPALRSVFTAKSERDAELRWGVAGICGVIVLLAAIGAVYVTAKNDGRSYAAELPEAGAIRTGDDVRVAGIVVGKVTSLTLLPDRVRMEFTVDDEVFVGDQTALDLRMLTLVGGYYVAVEPMGTEPLGDTVIPQERVGLPYNLTQAFQDAVQPVRQIDGTVFRQDLAALAESIGQSPDSIRAVIDAANSLVDVMNKQNADISQTLAVADEYLSALNANSDVLVQLVMTLQGLENIIQNNKFQAQQSLDDLATVLEAVGPLGRVWDDTLKHRAQPLADAIPRLQQLGDHLGGLLDSIRTLEQRLLPFLPPGGGMTVDQSAATIRPSSFCVPVPGGTC